MSIKKRRIISDLISYIYLIFKRMKIEEINIKDKIIEFLKTIKINRRGRVIDLKLNNPRKKPNQYSINPKI